jgi:hypothetical protein
MNDAYESGYREGKADAFMGAFSRYLYFSENEAGRGYRKAMSDNLNRYFERKYQKVSEANECI